MDYYQQYVKACLDQLAKAGNKAGRVQGPGQQGGSGFKKQSIKYNAHKLHEKGVILEIEGLPNHQSVFAIVVYHHMQCLVTTCVKILGRPL